MRVAALVGLILGGVHLHGCGPIDTHIYPVTISADPQSIYTGESTRITWSAPGGVEVLSSNFDAGSVSGWKDVSPSYSTEYKIKVRLASNDIYTAKCQVYVSDPIDDGGGDDGGEEGSSAAKRGATLSFVPENPSVPAK